MHYALIQEWTEDNKSDVYILEVASSIELVMETLMDEVDYFKWENENAIVIKDTADRFEACCKSYRGIVGFKLWIQQVAYRGE